MELFGERPTRGPTVSFLSLFLSFRLLPLYVCSFFFSLSLSFLLVFHPPPRYTLFLPRSFHLCRSPFLSVRLVLLRPNRSFVRGGRPQARQRWDQATRKDHLVLYILVPAAIILSTAFKNIRRSHWINRRKSVAAPSWGYNRVFLRIRSILSSLTELSSPPRMILDIIFDIALQF